MQEAVSVVLGRKRAPRLEIPGELLQCYQQVLGSVGTLAWINLRWMALTNVQGPIEEILQKRMNITPPQTMEALRLLTEYELLELAGPGKYVVHEPFPAEVFEAKFKAEGGPGREETVARVEEPEKKESKPAPFSKKPVAEKPSEMPSEVASEVSSAPEPAEVSAEEPSSSEAKPRRPEHRDQLQADIDALMRMYEKRIGLYSGSHVDKLRSWVEEKNMATEVVLRAIDEAALAKVPRLNYIEGILRNWYNSGIRTLPELDEWQKKEETSAASMEGMPNADAYKRVDQSLVQRWKELYPDEYDG